MPKNTAKTKTPTKKTIAAKTTAKSKPKTVKKPAPMPLISFQAADDRPFFEFRVTQQTLYWAILGAISIAFALWVLTLDTKIQKLYDEIDANNYSASYDMPTKQTVPTEQTEPTEQTVPAEQ